jgi:tetratricopeptide (TPR) repeat protein
MQAQARSPGRTLEDVNLEILARKAREEPTDFLWPFLLGWQFLQMGQFDDALKALENAKTKRPGDCRGAYAVATVYYTAATQARWPDGRWTEGEVSLGMSLIQLDQNALREFREALELAESGRDRGLIQSSIDAIELTLRGRQTRGR